MSKTGLALTLAVHGIVLLLAMSPGPSQPKSQTALLTTRLIPAAAAPVQNPLPKPTRPTLQMPSLAAPLPVPEFQISVSPEPTGVQAAPAATPAAAIVTAAAAPTVAGTDPSLPSSSYQPASLPPEHGSCSARGVERHYPALLRDRGVQGQVLLRVQVDEQGRAAEVLVQGGSGWRLLDDAARQIAKACPYLPARRGEQRLMAWVEYPIRFALH